MKLVLRLHKTRRTVPLSMKHEPFQQSICTQGRSCKDHSMMSGVIEFCRLFLVFSLSMWSLQQSTIFTLKRSENASEAIGQKIKIYLFLWNLQLWTLWMNPNCSYACIIHKFIYFLYFLSHIMYVVGDGISFCFSLDRIKVRLIVSKWVLNCLLYFLRKNGWPDQGLNLEQ